MKISNLLNHIELLSYTVAFLSGVLICIGDILNHKPFAKDMLILGLVGIVIAKTVELNQSEKEDK
jgi:hypothetical protein